MCIYKYVCIYSIYAYIGSVYVQLLHISISVIKGRKHTMSIFLTIIEPIWCSDFAWSCSCQVCL